MNKLGYYIKEGFSSIFTHGFMSFATIGIILACLIITGSVTLIAVNVDVNIAKLESENHIIAYVNGSYQEDEAKALADEIEKIDNVKDVTFVTNEQAMNEYFAQFDDRSQFDGFTKDDFRHRFIINLDDTSIMRQTQSAISNVVGIVKVSAHLELADSFVTVRTIATIATAVVAGILLIVSLFIMSNTVKLTTFERREEIAIMKMVGATKGFIRGPFVVEGMILGIMGALLAFLAQWGIYDLFLTRFIGNAGVEFVTVVPFAAFALYILGAFSVIGIGIGVFGSLIAIRNYLKV